MSMETLKKLLLIKSALCITHSKETDIDVYNSVDALHCSAGNIDTLSTE